MHHWEAVSDALSSLRRFASCLLPQTTNISRQSINKRVTNARNTKQQRASDTENREQCAPIHGLLRLAQHTPSCRQTHKRNGLEARAIPKTSTRSWVSENKSNHVKHLKESIESQQALYTLDWQQSRLMQSEPLAHLNRAATQQQQQQQSHTSRSPRVSGHLVAFQSLAHKRPKVP